MALQFFLNNLSKEIIFECNKEDIDCNINFILYYLKLLALDPLWNLYPTMKDIVRLDALRLIKFMVTKMKHQHCPCIITLKIQMYFNCNFEKRETIIDTERMNFRNRLKPLQDEIIETITEDKAEMILLRKKIIYYMALLRGLGNPTKIDVYREVRQALFSIYEESDLSAFMEKTKEDKVLELEQLAQICSGIRIFNWSCKKGGEGIEDLPKLLADAIKASLENLQTALVNTMDKVNILTNTTDYAFPVTETTEDEFDGVIVYYVIKCEVPNDVEYEDIEYAKDLLITFRQLEVFFRKIIAKIEEIEHNTVALNKKFSNCVNHFHSLVYLKVGIPTDIVFPIFIELDKIWEEYQDEMIYLTKLSQIKNNLDIYVKDLMLNMDVIRSIIGDKDILTDADRMDIGKDIMLTTSDSQISIISPSDDMKLEFLGFCGWKLVETQGGLIPGNPNLGVIRYLNKNYTFSCLEAIIEFQRNPTHYINEGLELARKKTELITLLELQEDLRKVQMVKNLVVEERHIDEKVTQQEAYVQTEVHPIETFIDRNYKWNIWDWTREALKLADTSKRAAHSTQTESSQNKGHVYTQTYDSKEQVSQTKKDNYTNVPTPQTFFFGLRGRKDDKQFILELTRPVDFE